jgi:hypothetical protein
MNGGEVLAALLLAVAPPARQVDSAKVALVERVIAAADDSLGRLRSASYGFRLDLAGASHSLILERARRVRDACLGSEAALDTLRSVLAGEGLTPRAAVEQGRLRTAALDLRRTLTRCSREWDPSPATAATADSLRAWGPYRAQQLDLALRRYLAALRAFQLKAGLKKPAVG